MTITFKATAGSWQPAIIVGAADGTTLFDGVDGLQAGYFNINTIKTGKTGTTAKIEIESVVDTDLIIYVTAWHVVEGNFNPSITTSAKYKLTASNVCSQSDLQQLSPCTNGSCWNPSISAQPCAGGVVTEDFSSGAYNVHAYSTSIAAGKTVTFNLSVTGGNWQPALIIRTTGGATIYDGKIGIVDVLLSLDVQAAAFGTTGSLASVEVTPSIDMDLIVYVTSWDTLNGDFVPGIPTNATYVLSALTECDGLLSPPNFDPSDVAGGYYILPPPSPAGLYSYKGHVPCSRGSKTLIDVLYTAATQWKAKYPQYGALHFSDLNEEWKVNAAGTPIGCSGVNHSTHDDGTHADISVSCGTVSSCTDIQPAIELAKIFIDTGATCGIIFNDVAVQDAVNSYFTSKYSYSPWDNGGGPFMWTWSGHNTHFHLRVKKPDGTCNP